MALRERSTTLLAVCYLVMMCLFSNNLVSATGGVKPPGLRHSMHLRQGKPPNRRLRKGLVYKNGLDRDYTEWENGKQNPKPQGILHRSETKPTVKQQQFVDAEAATQSEGIGLDAAATNLEEKDFGNKLWIDLDANEEGIREASFDGREWEDLENEWSSWGHEWDGDGTGTRPNQEGEREANSEASETWDWARDRNGGYGRDPLFDVQIAEEMYSPLAPADRKGGTGGTKKERGGRTKEARKGVGGARKVAKEHGAKHKAGRGSKGKKRKLQNASVAANRKGNLFKNPTFAREEGDPTGDDPAAKAKESLDHLQDLALFSNREWTHTFFKPVHGGKKSDVNDEEQPNIAEEHAFARGEAESDDEKKGKGFEQKGEKEAGTDENEAGLARIKDTDGVAGHEAQEELSRDHEGDQEIQASISGSDLGGQDVPANDVEQSVQEETTGESTQGEFTVEEDAQMGEQPIEKEEIHHLEEKQDPELNSQELTQSAAEQPTEDAKTEDVNPQEENQTVTQSTDIEQATSQGQGVTELEEQATGVAVEEKDIQRGATQPVHLPFEATMDKETTIPTKIPTVGPTNAPSKKAADATFYVLTRVSNTLTSSPTTTPTSSPSTPTREAPNEPSPEETDPAGGQRTDDISEEAAPPQGERESEEHPSNEEGFAWGDSEEDWWTNNAQTPKELPMLSPKRYHRNVPTTSTPSQAPTEWQDRSDCRICSSGHAATSPNRTVMHTKQTCQELSGKLDFSTGESCGQIKSEIPVDLEAYCGCPGVSFTSWCKFCPDGTQNLYEQVTIPSLNYMSCGDVENYAAYINNPEACARMDHLADLCCGTLDEYWRRPHTRASEYSNSRDWGDTTGSEARTQTNFGSGDGGGEQWGSGDGV